MSKWCLLLCPGPNPVEPHWSTAVALNEKEMGMGGAGRHREGQLTLSFWTQQQKRTSTRVATRKKNSVSGERGSLETWSRFVNSYETEHTYQAPLHITATHLETTHKGTGLSIPEVFLRKDSCIAQWTTPDFLSSVTTISHLTSWNDCKD